MPANKIEPLNDEVISRLRSSLVINSIPQCIKELICNAIDANATSIDILLDVEKYTIQVNDNGHGIQELSRIGQRHTSSKCHTLSDIQHLKTFGFRGEALAAITNESLTQIISRHRLSNETFEGFWKDGHAIGEIQPAKHTSKSGSGTTVILRDLFYKYPVRRKHISTYQHAVIIDSVKRQIIGFALCFNYINFNLIDSDRGLNLLSIKKTNSSLDTFRQQFGHDMTKHIKTLAMREGDIVIDGFFSCQGYPTKAHQYIYINNYYVPVQNELYKIVPQLFAASNFKKGRDKNRDKKVKYTQRHPIYLLRLICPVWSNYDIHMFLELFESFPDYPKIAGLIKALTIQFLMQTGLLSEDEPLPRSGQKRKRVSRESTMSTSTAKRSNTGHITTDPYLIHSSSVISAPTTSVYGTLDSSAKRTEGDIPQPRQLVVNEEKFITWWDPDKQELIYLDPKTGNCYSASDNTEFCSATNSHEIPPSQFSHENSIDRTHLRQNSLRQGSASVDLNSQHTISELFQGLMSDKALSMETPQKVSKDDLTHIRVLGQIDRKYIAIQSLNRKNCLIIIDQHAADERVKLEQMLRVGIRTTIALEPVIELNMESLFEVQALMDHRMAHYFKQWGIQYTVARADKDTVNQRRADFDISKQGQSRFFEATESSSPHFGVAAPSSPSQIAKDCRIYVTHIPELISDRCSSNHALLKDLIRDYMYWVISQQNNEVILDKTCPKGIMDILKSKACRSAVMFNDELRFEQCAALMENLARCNFPFQCAHGRPSAIPVQLKPNFCVPYTKRPKQWTRFIKKVNNLSKHTDDLT